MGEVVPFVRAVLAAANGPWTVAERGELQKLAAAITRDGMLGYDVALGLADTGEPWFAISMPASGETLLHVARIGGRFIVHHVADDLAEEGPDLRAVLRRATRDGSESLGGIGPGAAILLLLTQQTLSFLDAEAATGAPPDGDRPPPGLRADAPDDPAEAAEARVAAVPIANGTPTAPAPPAEAFAVVLEAPPHRPILAAQILADAGGPRPPMGAALAATPITAGFGWDLARGAEIPSGLLIRGTSGNDQLVGTDGSDTLRGLGGDDTLLGGNGRDRLHGGDGHDVLELGAGRDTGEGGDGDDWVRGAEGGDVLRGGKGRDSLIGDLGPDRAWGGRGDDLLRGGAGDDQLFGQQGIDRLFGNGGADLMYGGHARDQLHGNGGGDLINGGDGRDQIFGDQGDDSLEGGMGADALVGGPGGDTLFGGGGRDVLRGEGGDDNLDGGAGRGLLLGGAGNDTLIARPSHWLYGESGADVFEVNALAECFSEETHGPRALFAVLPDYRPEEGDTILVADGVLVSIETRPDGPGEFAGGVIVVWIV